MGQWLQALATISPELGFQGAATPQCDQTLSGAHWALRARELKLLTQQGRLDEAFLAAEGWGLSSAPEAEAGPEVGAGVGAGAGTRATANEGSSESSG